MGRVPGLAYHRLAWYTLIALVAAASLGTTMAIRWISVYRAQYYSQSTELGPPERDFPLTVVIARGVFAVTTPTLVLLTALGVFSS